MPSDAVQPEDFFVCQMCGDCCRGYGGTFVTEEDIRIISGYLNTDPGRFKASYCQLSGSKPVLAQAENGYCIFWDQICTIHPVKPRMCKNWPFIESVLVDADNWKTIAASCPGIRTDKFDSRLRAYVKKVLSMGS